MGALLALIIQLPRERESMKEIINKKEDKGAVKEVRKGEGHEVETKDIRYNQR